MSLKHWRAFIFVERIAKLKIFMQLDIIHYKKGAMIISNKEVIPFYELFSNLNRTGSHIPEGDIFSTNIEIPHKIENHKFIIYL